MEKRITKITPIGADMNADRLSKRSSALISVIISVIFIFSCAISAWAGQLKFDNVPVDITTADNDDLILAPGSGGNTQIGVGTGTNSYATSQNDLFITGISETSGAGYFDSALTITGALTANGNVTLGDSASDTITPNGRLAASLLPSADSTYNLGSTTLAFSSFYVDTISGYNSALALSPASGYSLTGAVTKNTATGDETAYDLAAAINKATSGNYTGLKLNVTETLAPGSADKLLDLQVGGTSWIQVYNGANSANYGLLSVGSDDWDGSTSGYFAGSSSGTLIAGNAASGFAGNLLDLQVNGVSKYRVAYDGVVTSTGSQTVTGNITPSVDSVYDLGSTSAAWLNLYADNIKTVSGTNLTILPTLGYTIIGDAAAPLKASANDDLFVSGVLENRGAAYLATTTGSVGIGTTSPAYKLDVNGTLNATTITQGGTGVVDGTGTANYVPKWSDSNTLAGTSLIYDNGTNVGIGTTGPSGRLQVTGDEVRIGDSGTLDKASADGDLYVEDELEVDGQCVTGDTLLPVLRPIRVAANGYGLMANGYEQEGDEDGVLLRKIRRMANVDGTYREGLRRDEEISQGRTIWADITNEKSSSISSSEYSGGQGSLLYERVYPVSLHGQRFTLRNDYIDQSLIAAELSEQGGIRNSLENITGDTEQDQWSHQLDEINSQQPLATSLQYLPITDVKPGDYVLSLNEESGKIEPHRINGLLDMGVKPVFKLTTASGRFIKTTGNHPYLVYQYDHPASTIANMGFSIEGELVLADSFVPGFKWIKVAGLSVGDKIVISSMGVLPGKIKYDHEVNNQHKDSNYVEDSVSIHSSLPFASPDNPQIDNQGQYTSSNIEVKQGHGVVSFVFDILANLIARLRNNIVEAAPIINVSQGTLAAAPGANMPTTEEANIIFAPSRRKSEITSISSLANIQTNSNMQEDFVKYFINSDVIIDEVIAIEYLNYEHVYDIEVEGTHNFVANGIIAHNTYISGNTGIGTTSPLAKFEIIGAGTGTGFALKVQDSANADKLAFLDSGKLGIGTTLPTAGLTIGTGTNTNATSGNDLYVTGNLEIDGSAWLGDTTADNLTIAGSLTQNAPLTITSTTTPQFSLRYDTSNYWESSVSSAGAVTLNAVGTGAGFSFSDSLTANTFASSGATITGGTINSASIGATTASSGAFTTLSSTGATTLGNTTATVAVDSSDWDISTTGALTGISGITNDGAYTQTGTSANAFTGTPTFSNATYSALFTGGNVGIGTTGPGANVEVYQPASGTRGFLLSGNSVTGGPVSSNGVLFSLGYNDTNNRQLWLTDSAQYGNASYNSFRYVVGFNIPGIDAVDNAGINRKNMSLGFTDTNVGIGFDFSSASQSDIKSKLSIKGNASIGSTYTGTAAPTNGLIIEGNLGIGTTSPAAKFEIIGAGTGTGFALKVQDSANADKLAFLDSGKLGIGTTLPTAGLTIGTGTNTNATSGNDLYVTGNLEIDGSSWLGDAATDNLTVTGTFTQSGNLDMGNNLILNIGNAATDFDAAGGLTLAGDLAVNGADLTTTATTFNLLNTTATTLNLAGAATTLEIGAATGTASINNSLTVDGNTTLGTGTEDSVTLNADAITIANDTDVTLSGGVNGLSFDGTTLSIDAANDRVGIGTTGPRSVLQVAGTGEVATFGTDTGAGVTYLTVTAAANQQTGINFDSAGTNTWYMYRPAGSTDLRFWDNTADRVTFQTGGNVGIGTTGPAEKLEVADGTNKSLRVKPQANYVSLYASSTEVARLWQ